MPSPPPPPPNKKKKRKKHVLIDRLLHCAVYKQEKGILNNSETDSIHALFSISKIYILSHFSETNVWLVDICVSKLYMFYKVASETIYEKMGGGEKKKEG